MCEITEIIVKAADTYCSNTEIGIRNGVLAQPSHIP